LRGDEKTRKKSFAERQRERQQQQKKRG